jgi:hypothetical protein
LVPWGRLEADDGVGLRPRSVALWAHYGTAVFFEMIRTGLAACFG